MATTSLRAAALNRWFISFSAEEILRVVIKSLFAERTALVSSFGTEAAVLLHMVSRIDPGTPILFLDTLKHFDETLEYRDRLIARLKLTNVRNLQPASSAVDADDPAGILWAQDSDRCCHLRKVRPLEDAAIRFDALITGRKRHHGAGRAMLNVFESDGKRLKINPLASWRRQDVVRYMSKFGLPQHPLENQGYPSVGCAVCTSRVKAGEDFRSGRWRGQEKTECGIHLTWNKGARS